MSEQKLENEFIEIEKLENKDFFIPSYQRGYRWGEREIIELLNDINDFMVDKKENDFYCLQPIVVKEDKSKYEVIDGQQRLTTIFLIIKYLENKNYFKIEYETRKKSFEFLAEIKDKDENSTNNIDFYHFLHAYKSIKKFFEKNSNIDKKRFYDTLINDCKVLWYKISEDEIEQEVFIRLNIGKIPLLEEENIKALFLSKTDGVNKSDLEDRAKTWDDAEKKLRAENDYSYLVLNKINKEYIEKDSNKKYILNDDFLRIKVYLNAITDEIIKGKNRLFNYFHGKKKNNQLNEEWDKLRKCMSSLQGFASRGGDDIERDIFHYIGFLILNDIKINDIYKIWNSCENNKLSFSEKLLENIKEHISTLIDSKKVSNYIKKLRFKNTEEDNDKKENKKEIFKILVLFNIDILLKDKSSKNYFDFNRFQLEEASLEHIHAQNSKSIISILQKDKKDNNKKEEIIKWLEEINKYIEEDEENKDLTKRIKDTIEDIKTKTIKNKIEFNEILNENNLLDDIDDNFNHNKSLQGIGNLCLLDKASNSSFGNDIFSIKKKKIEELIDKNEKFIPIATKQVFNKDFSNKSTHKDLFTKEDRDDYMNKIIESIKDYI